jgi:hypothetical protein
MRWWCSLYCKLGKCGLHTKVALAKHVVLWDKPPALNGMHSSTARSAELGCLLTAASVSVSGSRGSCVHFVDLPSVFSIASALASKRSGSLRESAACSCLQCTAARRRCNLADAARSNCGFSHALCGPTAFFIAADCGIRCCSNLCTCVLARLQEHCCGTLLIEHVQISSC